MTWSPAVPGAALRAMRVAAGRRAVQLALLVGMVFVLGVLCGERAQAADGTPAREHPSAAAPVAADANTAGRLVDTLTAPAPDVAESIRQRPETDAATRSRPDAGDAVRPRPETTGPIRLRLEVADASGRPSETGDSIRPGDQRPKAAEPIRPRPEAGEAGRSRPGTVGSARLRPGGADASGRRSAAVESSGRRAETGDAIRSRSDAGEAIGSRPGAGEAGRSCYGAVGSVRLGPGVGDAGGGDTIRLRVGEGAGLVRVLAETVAGIVGASGMPGDVPGVLPDLPLLPDSELPGWPGGAPVHILPELIVPGTDQPSAPTADAPDGPAGNAATPSDGPAPATPHGPALTGIGGVPSGAGKYQGGHGHGTPAPGGVTAGWSLAPHAPADNPADGAMGSDSAADAGTQRHGDASAVPAFHRPVPHLVPGPALRTEATGTQDRCRDVPVSPA